ncbi:D12 class N6 adenine-specific DNA methyltransferase [uncultured Alphaproteobacteria bacterium]|uniref:site-specific DNA-methyltransferase (adenine-specific) n=1 Tax=uncultured Alphaproteobacteria bacterium TaxID=91750 RepID=A0A212KBR5_9PROT|nr:D12 class N6 adenine-specific DNA methyltransferase [uncultured Alphaproteobacteria bacterium]
MHMESTLSPIRAIHPVTPYLGGKRNLAKRLVAEIERIPHATYAEPFVGGGGVFLRRTSAPRAEVINDLNRDVATFFRILQRHYVAFMEMIKFQLTTRAEFERLVATDPDTLTDLERSARFLYLQRTAFGGKVSGRNFGVSPGRPGHFDVTKLGPLLEDLHTRLAGVVIECLPYASFITRYDRPETLFYLDPPYWGCEGDYGRHLFERADFERLADQLATLKGRFLMSINDTPEIRAIFAGFDLAEVSTTYTVAGRGNAKAAAELLISGGGCDGDASQASSKRASKTP